MHKALTTTLLVTVGAFAAGSLYMMGATGAAAALGLGAIAVGGLMAAGVIDPIDDAVKPVIRWLGDSSQQALGWVRSKISGLFGGKKQDMAEASTPAAAQAPGSTPDIVAPELPAHAHHVQRQSQPSATPRGTGFTR